MKIQCDVCEKQEASVFCAADEAALCDECDHRVHHANKLATKHQRFPLLHPSCKDAPRCDICQEKRAFLFCKEDRAILCRECDIQIHKANEHTQNHHRFLLTGVKISASSTPYPNSSVTSSEPTSRNSNTSKITSSSSTNYSMINEVGSISTNNFMPEYLMDDDMPGWRLEDLLDSSYGFQSKNFDSMNNVNPNNQVEEESMGSYCSTEEYSRMWEFHPQEPLVPSHFPSIFLDR
ncbi:B-box zinc finger protein 21-like [Silene latifolia]|uniref:B-box zinc finger protein 21-like n=1 Tax=Silene latifolia TaxID=37657 RepID=UPI003D770142